MKKFLILLLLLLFFNSQAILAEKSTNFALFNTEGERKVFYHLLEKLPENGIIILNFTSVHCKPCEEEIPELEKIASEYKKKTMLMVIFAESGEMVNKKVQKLGITGEVFVDPLSTVQRKFSVKGYPQTVLVAKNKEILGSFFGYNIKQIYKIQSIVHKYEKR
jgi:thiol-disulfide isomerase/thioredoxin